MITAESISFIAVAISGLSAIYARRALVEARKANELNRFKTLLDLKNSYLEDMNSQIQAAKEWGKDDSFSQACRDKFAAIDIKYREVSKELDVYHSRLIKNEL